MSYCFWLQLAVVACIASVSCAGGCTMVAIVLGAATNFTPGFLLHFADLKKGVLLLLWWLWLHPESIWAVLLFATAPGPQSDTVLGMVVVWLHGGGDCIRRSNQSFSRPPSLCAEWKNGNIAITVTRVVIVVIAPREYCGSTFTFVCWGGGSLWFVCYYFPHGGCCC